MIVLGYMGKSLNVQLLQTTMDDYALNKLEREWLKQELAFTIFNKNKRNKIWCNFQPFLSRSSLFELHFVEESKWNEVS